MTDNKESNFTHLLLTRFNLKIPKLLKENEINKKIWINPDWLECRFELFEKYCFPSVQSQKNKNFTWLVFFHPDTPDIYKEKIAGYRKQLPNFKPIFVETHYDIPEAVKNNVEFKKWLITSRLDNDDAISIDHIANIQKYFEPKHSSFIDLLMGYTLNAKDGKVNIFRYLSNSFASYVEDSELPVKMIYSFNHSYLKDQPNFKSIQTEPSWLVVIHEGNLANIFLGKEADAQQRLDFEHRFKLNI